MRTGVRSLTDSIGSVPALVAEQAQRQSNSKSSSSRVATCASVKRCAVARAWSRRAARAPGCSRVAVALSMQRASACHGSPSWPRAKRQPFSPSHAQLRGYFRRIGFAGLPATAHCWGTSRVTTAPAPTMAFAPIDTPGSTMARKPINAWAPTVMVPVNKGVSG